MLLAYVHTTHIRKKKEAKTYYFRHLLKFFIKLENLLADVRKVEVINKKHVEKDNVINFIIYIKSI